ncbi:cell wall hydrolase [Halanaerobaculum tunisiense]
MRQRIIQTISLSLVVLLVSLLVTSPLAQAGEVTIDKETAYKGLLVTGVLVLTINWLTEDGEPTNKEEISTRDHTTDELKWLAKAVNGEARGEPYQGQVAVAAVILNRVASNQFPDTIYSVIHQKEQFSSVQDGQINLPPTSSAYQAAKEALSGVDPSQGALYFYNPQTADFISWFQTKEVTARIGDHTFAK